MNGRILASTLLFLFAVPVVRADSMLTSSNDPFDSTNGTIILSHDAITDPINMFATSGGFEDGNTLMRNGGLNSVSFVNFRTAAPVSITGIRVTAMMEWFYGTSARRALNRIRLLADTDNNGTFETLLVDEPVTVPYTNEVCNITGTMFLDRNLAFPLTTSRDWRIEITQGSDLQPYEGARVIEVDALTSFADAAISSSGPTSVTAGTNVIYTSTITNLGPPTATPVIVNNVTPSGLTFVSNTGNCTTAFPCDLGSIAQGASRVITTTYFVPSSYVGSISNTFQLDQSLGNPGCTSVAANDVSTVGTTVTQSADVSVSKTGPSGIVPGQNVVYTVSVTNNGPSDAQSVSVVDTTPSGLTFVSNTGNCTTAFPCALGTIPAGQTRTITTTFSVPASYQAPDPVVNTATVSTATSDPNAGNDTATSSIPLAPVADLSIVKTGPASIVPGQNAVFSISVTNGGPSDAHLVSVADATPAGLTFVSNAGDCATAFPCALGTIAVGQTKVVTSTFLAPSSYLSPDPVVNTATVTSTASDPDPSDDTSSSSTPLAASADLSVTKSGPATIVPGRDVTYTVTVTNDGPSDAQTVSLADPTPAGLTFVSNTGDCATSYPCALGTLAAGATKSITTTYSVPATYLSPDPVVNTATASSLTPDSDASDDTSSVSVPVATSADLSVTKTGPATIVPGLDVTHTVTVTNNGPSDAQSVSLADPTPSGLTFVSNTGDCATSYPCALGTLAVGATRTVTSTYSVPAAYSTPDPLANTATVSSSTSDPDASNDSSSASSSIGVEADLEIAKAISQPGTAGQTIAYTISVTNHGPSVAPSVLVSDPDLFPLSNLVNSGACTTTFPCTLTNLAVGETRTINAVFEVASDATSTNATNTAFVSLPSGVDPNPANDSASVESLVQVISDIVLLVSQPHFVGGDTLTFAITVQNLGPSDSGDVVIQIPTPVGMTLVSSPPGCGGSFPCTLGSITAGSSIRFDVTFMISGTTESPLVVTVSAECESDPNASDNTVSVSLDTCPSQITGMSPLDGALDVAQSGTLEWEAINADVFEVYFGLAGSGCTTLAGTTPYTTWPYANLKRRSQFEWMVVGKKAGCPTGDVVSACQRFDSGPPCPVFGPELLFPPEGGLDYLSPVKFEWTPVLGAVSYKVWASIDNTPPVVIGTSDGTALVYEASPGSFVWWVEAVFDDCPSVQSAPGTFTTSGSCVTRAATLNLPENGVELSSPVIFDWEPVGGAQSYSVWISVDGKFPIVVASTTTETEATVAVPSGSLRWYVQSRYEKCPPAISEIRTIVVPPRPECAANEAPLLLEPFSGQRLLSPIEFSWTPVAGATGYTVWASIDGDSPSIVASTDSVTRVEQELRPGEVTWFVQANFDQCPSTESAESSFVVLEPGSCDFDTPQPLYPANATTVGTSIVTFEWLESAGSVEYRVWASIDGSDEQLLASIPATKTSVEVAVPVGSIEWNVEALFIGCPSKRSGGATFIVPRGTNCGEGTFLTLSPRGGVIGEEENVTFIWQEVSGAVEYRLWLVPDSGSRTMIAATASPTLSTQIEPGRYSWFVEAISDGCPRAYSDTPSLTIEANPDCANRRPTALAPADGAADLTSPVTFVWTPVPEATSYRLTVTAENAPPLVLMAGADVTELTVPMPAGVATWSVAATTESCKRASSTESELRVIELSTCSLPSPPAASVVGEVTEGETYKLLWDKVPGATIYEVQQTPRFNESLGIPDFTGETVLPTTSFVEFTAQSLSAGQESLTLYYRVRGIADCSQQRGPYSTPVAVVVTADNQSAQIGSLDLIERNLTLCADDAGRVFECAAGAIAKRSSAEVSVVLSPSEPWLKVEPDSGTIPAGGSLTVRIGADPTVLPTGTSTAALLLGTSAGRSTTSSPGSVPVSVGLASPVTPNPKTTPPPHAQIIPAVIHADSSTGTWQSDIRILNTAAKRQKYQLSFTPSDVDGTKQGKQAVVEVGSGEVLAFDDVVRSWYGSATRSLTGVLEVRPASVPGGTQAGSTIASSRTYNSTPFGSFGQFISGVPFSRFLGKSPLGESLLLLQQISQSSRFRTNFGFVEANGEPVEILLKLFSSTGSLLGEKTISLQAGQHTQLNALMAQMGITAEDARAEIRVTSETGRITAYASVVDAMTSDPTFMPAVNAGESVAARRVLPGIADLDTGQNRWRSDVLIYNPAAESVETTLTFYPQGAPGSPVTQTLVIAPGEIAVLDDILRTTFASTNIGGALHVQTAGESSLVVTARTYDLRPDGTVGQFIPALTEQQAATLGGRVLHILQVEESDRLRSNLGLAELSGSPAEVEVTAVVPRTLSAPVIRLSLAPNEFRQIGSIFRELGYEQVFNGRLIVRVVGGEGKVVAYASSVDNATGDPAYIPAQ